MGDDGIGDEDTNATVLGDEDPFLLPGAPIGVFSGDRRHDFVGEENPCICVDARRTDSVHSLVRSVTRLSCSLSNLGEGVDLEIASGDDRGAEAGWSSWGGNALVSPGDDTICGLDVDSRPVEVLESLPLPMWAPKMPYDGCLIGEEPKLDSGSRILGLKSNFCEICLKYGCDSSRFVDEEASILSDLLWLDCGGRVLSSEFLGRTGGSLLGEAASKAKTSWGPRSRTRGLKLNVRGPEEDEVTALKPSLLNPLFVTLPINVTLDCIGEDR